MGTRGLGPMSSRVQNGPDRTKELHRSPRAEKGDVTVSIGVIRRVDLSVLYIDG